MKGLLFCRIVIANRADGHLNAVDNRFCQADQGPYGGDADAAGADEADLLSPDLAGEVGCSLAFSRRDDAGQIGDEDDPCQERAD